MELWKILLIVGICIGILLLSLVVVFILLKKKKANNKVEEYPNLLSALGGKDNLVSITVKGSRVNVEIKDKKLVDKDTIKEEVDTIVVSSKKVTMVAGNDKSIKICDYLNQMLVVNE